MSGYALNNRLAKPRRETDFAGLTKTWKQETIELRMEGMASFSTSASLLNKVRGALGAVLLESASQAVHERRPCTWSPPCAAEVFFGKKPSIRIGPYESEITKPFVLSCEVNGQDLIIRMSVFGFACEWIAGLVSALVQALRTRVRWRDLAKDGNLFIPARLAVREPHIVFIGPIELRPTPKSVMLEFCSPLDSERGSLEERPHLIFERLVSRIVMLARWHDAGIRENWDCLEKVWLACRYVLPTCEQNQPKLRGGHKFRNIVASRQIIGVTGDLEPLWPLLVIGEYTNIGRGANIGLGKYRVRAENFDLE